MATFRPLNRYPTYSSVAITEIDDLDWAWSIIKRGARAAGAEAIRFVLAGGIFVPASILMSEVSERLSDSNTRVTFTKRQRTVLAAVCKAMTNKQIAYELGMSEHTVKVHDTSCKGSTPRTEPVAVLGRGLLEIS